MKYSKKVFRGPKIDKIRLKFSPFYRYQVHLMYRLGILPSKIEYGEKTPEYYKQKQENLNIMEEFSFIAKHHIESIEDLKICEVWFEGELNIDKGAREELYTKLKRTTNTEERKNIKYEIGFLTYKINHTANELKVCRRFMWRRNLLHQEDVKLREQEIIRNEIKNQKIDSKCR